MKLVLNGSHCLMLCVLIRNESLGNTVCVDTSSIPYAAALSRVPYPIDGVLSIIEVGSAGASFLDTVLIGGCLALLVCFLPYFSTLRACPRCWWEIGCTSSSSGRWAWHRPRPTLSATAWPSSRSRPCATTTWPSRLPSSAGVLCAATEWSASGGPTAVLLWRGF